jgi:hypothetical protein
LVCLSGGVAVQPLASSHLLVSLSTLTPCRWCIIFSTGPLIRTGLRETKDHHWNNALWSSTLAVEAKMGGTVLFLPFLSSWQAMRLLVGVRRNARSIARWE